MDPRIQNDAARRGGFETRPYHALDRVAGRRLAALLEFMRHSPSGAFGLLTLLVVLGAALFAPLIAPYDHLAQDAEAALKAPSPPHPFGTDYLGRDMFSRVVFGARVSMTVAVTALVIGTVLGVAVGLVSGYLGGAFDAIAQRFVDTLMAFPALILSLAIVGFLAPSAANVATALAITFAPRIARLIRGSVLSLKESEYVFAARALGCTGTRIMARHLLPNTLPLVIVFSSLFLGTAILAEAVLSFLGVGIPPPAPSWGRMLSGASADYLQQAPWLTIFPGLAITLTVLAANLLGDALRDALDPRLRRL